MNTAKQLTDQAWKLIEAKRLDGISDIFDADCDFKMPGMEIRGLAPLRDLFAAYYTAFPNLQHQVKHSVESGDTVAVELRITGTHTGPMQTPQGTVPATGKEVVWESCDYVRAKNGKIVSWHVYQDSVPFLTALGLIPAPR